MACRDRGRGRRGLFEQRLRSRLRPPRLASRRETETIQPSAREPWRERFPELRRLPGHGISSPAIGSPSSQDLPVQAVFENPFASGGSPRDGGRGRSQRSRRLSSRPDELPPCVEPADRHAPRAASTKRPDDVAGRHLLAFSLYTSVPLRRGASRSTVVVDSPGIIAPISPSTTRGMSFARVRKFRQAPSSCWREALKLADAPLLAEKARHRIAQAIDLMGLERSLTDTRPGHAHAPKAQ